MTVNKSHSIVIRVCIIAALAGLLFGLDIAYVNGALEFIIRDFNLTEAQAGSVAGYLLAGAAVGALFSGWLSHKFGRKKILVLAALIFTFITIFGAMANDFTMFLWARFIVGLAVGIASFVAPLYLSEVAPYHIRGGLIAMYQLMITVGIFLMFISNTALSYTGSWRIMMLVLVIPSAIMLIGALTLPESPRWKVLMGKITDAENILNKIRNNKDEVKFELDEIKTAVAGHTGSFALLSKGYFLKVVLLGILLQALQQFCGMNAFMYYSGQIFASAGFANPALSTVTVGLVNVLTTLLAIKYVDKLGRKPILYFGMTILVIACAIVGYVFKLQTDGTVLDTTMQYTLLAACLFFIFGFAISLGPIIWILCAEIFPLEGRDLGITITTMTNWICNTVIGAYTLTWFTQLGVGNTFWIFGTVSLAGFALIKFFTPETKDVPLEELEFNLKSGTNLAQIGHRTTK
jgi:MFS transporter, SP family, galactose:H+ symporter